MRPDEYRKLAETEDRMWYFRALHRRRAHWLARLLPGGPARVLDAGLLNYVVPRATDRKRPVRAVCGCGRRIPAEGRGRRHDFSTRLRFWYIIAMLGI